VGHADLVDAPAARPELDQELGREEGAPDSTDTPANDARVNSLQAQSTSRTLRPKKMRLARRYRRA
jgi:hypothetical protein